MEREEVIVDLVNRADKIMRLDSKKDHDAIIRDTDDFLNVVMENFENPPRHHLMQSAYRNMPSIYANLVSQQEELDSSLRKKVTIIDVLNNIHYSVVGHLIVLHTLNTAKINTNHLKNWKDYSNKYIEYSKRTIGDNK